MKKLLILVTFVVIALNANAYNYKAWCGVEWQTVPPEFFATKAEADEYYAELSVFMCGSAEDDNIDHPAPTDEDDGNRP